MYVRKLLQQFFIVVILLITISLRNCDASSSISRRKRAAGARFGLKGGYSSTSAAAVDEASGEANGIQVYITKSMRKTLDKLGYLSKEIDEMDPQIAAVVIERSLHRPRSGMPANWRVERSIETKPAAPAVVKSKKGFNQAASRKTGNQKSTTSRSSTTKAMSRNKKSIASSPIKKNFQIISRLRKRLVLPVIAIGAVYAIKSMPLGSFAKNILSRFSSTTISSVANGKTVVIGQANTEKENHATEKTSTVSIVDEKVKETAVVTPIAATATGVIPSSRVNIQALEQVRHDNPLDSLHVNYSILKSKYM